MLTQDREPLRPLVESWFAPAALAQLLGRPATRTESMALDALAQGGKRWRPLLAAQHSAGPGVGIGRRGPAGANRAAWRQTVPAERHVLEAMVSRIFPAAVAPASPVAKAADEPLGAESAA